MPKLTVQNAEIKTATVEVRTLTLSGKQVTLSVFKQIEKESIFLEDGRLAGEAWGRVNYHPDPECKDLATITHHHIVWQKGGDLRRCLILEQLRWSEFLSSTAEDFMTMLAFDYFRGDRSNLPPSGELPLIMSMSNHAEAIGIREPMGGVSVDFEGHEAATAAYRSWLELQASDTESGRERPDWGGRPTESRHDRALRLHEDAMSKLQAVVDEIGVSTGDLRQRVADEIAAEVQRRDRIREAVRSMVRMQQLFIAV